MREYLRRPEAKARAAARKARYRAANRQLLAQKESARYKEKREDILPKRAAFREANRESIRKKHREYCRTWRAEQGNKLRAYMAKWQREHREQAIDHKGRRRARERGNYAERISWKTVWANFDGTCGICHQPLRLGVQPYHYDHRVPLAQGGAHASHNLQVAHAVCNLRKNNGRVRRAP